MEYKERLERATLMAMQGLLANPLYDYLRISDEILAEDSFTKAKATLEYFDSQFANQETQEQESKQPQIELTEVGQWCWYCSTTSPTEL